MAKKSKKFRIATEGATCDGRTIERAHLEQMAKNYNPKTYGARVNLEHFKSVLPDSPFRRFGDVLALSTEQVDGKLCLFAEIDPTDDLVAMTKARQKIYTSMEVQPNFADTGEAYLVGLAVTDDPASLGTEILQFSATAAKSPLAKRKLNPGNLFSEAVEVTLEFIDDTPPSDDGKTLFTKVKELLAGKNKTDESRFADQAAAIEAVAESQRDLIDRFGTGIRSLEGQLAALIDEQKKDRDAFTQLTETLSTSGDGAHQRPPATGGKNAVVTDC